MKYRVEVGNLVKLDRDVEVEPLCIVKQGTVGKVVDKTVPDYFLVKTDNGSYWIDEKHLTVVNW